MALGSRTACRRCSAERCDPMTDRSGPLKPPSPRTRWQPMQPFSRNSFAPRAGSPSGRFAPLRLIGGWGRGQTVALADSPHTVANCLLVGSAQVGALFEALLVAFQQMREILFEEWKKYPLRGRHQEYQAAAEVAGARCRRGCGQAILALFAIGDQGQNRI